MEDKIHYLSDKTDQATKQILQNVIDRKRKYDLTEKKLKISRIITFTMLGLFLFYVWFFILKATNYSFSISIPIFFNNIMNLYVLFLIFIGVGSIQYFDKKKEKAEKEYHDLRCEIVKRSTDLWPQPEKWDYRLEALELMKNEFDINLYHESK